MRWRRMIVGVEEPAVLVWNEVLELCTTVARAPQERNLNSPGRKPRVISAKMTESRGTARPGTRA